MIEFQGWLIIVVEKEYSQTQSPTSIQDHLGQSKIKELEKEIKQHSNTRIDGGVFNGQEKLWAMGFHNHRGERFEKVLELFRSVCMHKPESYGVLAFFDDEDPDHSNNYRNYIFKRGKVSLVVDSNLSPYFNEIEPDPGP